MILNTSSELIRFHVILIKFKQISWYTNSVAEITVQIRAHVRTTLSTKQNNSQEQTNEAS